MSSNSDSISLNKFLADTGLCSRRQADEWIKNGRVKLNGAIAKSGNRVEDGDEVLLDGKALKEKPKSVYLVLNKPRGIVCTTDPKEPKNIIDHIGYRERLFPIGRLDKQSQGLIILTNDGNIVNKILRAGNKHEKEYIVRIKGRITDAFIEKMGNGLPILDTVTQKCLVEPINKNTFRIVLTQGLNRQIRRMCEYLGEEVAMLKRVRIMHIKLGELKMGKWRKLSKVKYKKLMLTIKHSSNN